MNTDRYRRWFEYEKDSHQKVLASLNAVSGELRTSPPFQKAIDLMAHIVAARRVWLYRFGISREPAELFPQYVKLADLPPLLDSMQTAWSEYLVNLDDAELGRVFEYQSFEGARFRNTIEDILTQLFGHSLYHRGQIAMILRSIGAEPAVTDFVYWTREPL
ncbi:MAG: DinB family protein [Pyrinomonadaceae bacterium]